MLRVWKKKNGINGLQQPSTSYPNEAWAASSLALSLLYVWDNWEKKVRYHKYFINLPKVYLVVASNCSGNKWKSFLIKKVISYNIFVAVVGDDSYVLSSRNKPKALNQN